MDNSILETVDRAEFTPLWEDRNGRRLGDPWGTAMGLMFDMCAFMWHADFPIPTDWHYSPGANPSAEVRELKRSNPWRYDAFMRTEPDTFVRTGHVLNRYIRMLDRNGFSY